MVYVFILDLNIIIMSDLIEAFETEIKNAIVLRTKVQRLQKDCITAMDPELEASIDLIKQNYKEKCPEKEKLPQLSDISTMTSQLLSTLSQNITKQ